MEKVALVLITALTSGSAVALIALGINIVFATTRIVNFAQGGIVVAAGYLAFVFTDPGRFGLNVWVAFLLIIVVGVLLGIFTDVWGVSALGGFSAAENPGWLIITASMVGLIVFWVIAPVPVLAALCGVGVVVGTLLGAVRAAPLGKFDPQANIGWIITTFAIGTLLAPNIISRAVSAESQKIPDLVGGKAFDLFGAPVTWSDILLIVVAIGLVLGIEALLARTMLGRAFNAVSQDPSTASLMGIDTGRIVIIAFALAGALAAIAAVLIAPKLFVKLENSILLAFSALVAAVLGGLGSTRGAVVGAYVVALIGAFVDTFVPNGTRYSQAVVFLVLLIVLRFKPNGLYGKVAVEKV